MPLSLDVPDRFGRRVGEEGLGHLRALVYDAAPRLDHFGLKRALTSANTNTNSSSSSSPSGEDALYRIEEANMPGQQQQQQQAYEEGESDTESEKSEGSDEREEVFGSELLVAHTAPEGPALLKHSSFHPLLDKVKALGSDRSEASVSEAAAVGPIASTLSSSSSQHELVSNHLQELDGLNEPPMISSIYARKKQYAEEVDKIRSKTLELDAINSDIGAFMSSTHAVSEATAGSIEAIGSKLLQGPQRLTSFSVGRFWEQVRVDHAQESRQHHQALKRTRENCVTPLSLHSSSLQQRLHLMLDEADELDAAIEKAGEKCEAAIMRCNELNEVYKQMCIVARKRPEQLNTNAKLRLIEAQSDAYEAKMQRVEVASSFHNLAAHFCTRMPELIEESRTMNRTRLQHLNSSVKEFISVRQHWLQASLEQAKRLELCSNELDLETDAAQFGTSRRSSSTREAVPASPTHDLNAYLSSADRMRSYPLDMWGAEGFERALQQAERSKNTLRQLVTALEGWSAAMSTSSKSLHRLVGQASKSISGSEREKAASKSLVTCLNNESRHLATTSKTLQSGASVLSVIRTDGKNLKKTLSEQKLRFDKENRVAAEVLAKALSWRTQCQQEFGVQRKAMTALENFEACPRQTAYEKQLGVFKQSQAQMLQAEKKWRQAERVSEATHTKHQVCMAHFMHMLQDAAHRRTTDVKLVLERLQTQLRRYLHSMTQNFETVEKNVAAIDANVEIVEFIQQQRGRSGESNGPTFIVSLDDGPVSFAHQLGRTSFEAVRSHFSRGIDSFKQLTRFFEERNAIDDAMLKGIRKLPLDLTSAEASTLTDAFASFRKLMDCTLVSVDERNTRVAEVTRAMLTQRKVMKTSLAEFTQQYNRETRHANQASDTNKALLVAYKKSMSSLKQAREGHEQATLRERKSLSGDGSGRRKSFIQTVLRKPVKKYREKLDGAIEAVEKARALSEDATRALDAAVDERNRCVNSLLDGLQQAQCKRVETMRFAMLSCVEQHHTTTEKMLRQSDVLARTIEAIDAVRDLDAFIRANTSSQQPPDCVIGAHLEALKEARERSTTPTQLWSEDSNGSERDEVAFNTASTNSGSASLNAASTSTPSDDAQSVMSWRVDTISKRKAARHRQRQEKADDLVELFKCDDLDKELRLEDEPDADGPDADERAQTFPFSQSRLTTEELCHQCIEQLRYRDIMSSDVAAAEQEHVGTVAEALRRDLASGSVSATLSKAASEIVLRLLVLLLAEVKERPLCSSRVLDCLTPQLLSGECRENEPTLIEQIRKHVGALLRALLLLLLHASSRNKPCRQELARLFAVAVIGENEVHDIARLNWLIENCEDL